MGFSVRIVPHVDSILATHARLFPLGYLEELFEKLFGSKTSTEHAKVPCKHLLLFSRLRYLGKVGTQY